MSLTEILQEVDKLSDIERKELIEFLLDAEKQDKKIEAKNGEKQIKTIFDVASELVGSVASGIGDLSTNKKYMEGFGRE